MVADPEPGGAYGTPGASALAHYQRHRAGEWRRPWGAAHRPAASALLRAGWIVLHDVAIPGGRANGDHLLVGPPGVFLVDSKAWHGRITLGPDGSAWHNGQPMVSVLDTVRWEAEQLTTALGARVLPMLCVHDTQLPWGELYTQGIPC